MDKETVELDKQDFDMLLRRIEQLKRRMVVLDDPLARSTDCGCPVGTVCNNVACPRQVAVTCGVRQ